MCMMKKKMLFALIVIIRLFVCTAQGPLELSAEPSTPRHQTAVDLTCVRQTDQICMVSKRDLVVIEFVVHMGRRQQVWVLHDVYD